MTYEDFKLSAQTGDALLVHGHSAVQQTIEAVTNSAFCHVALLVVNPVIGLLVCEMVEGCGYQCMTIDDWVAGRPGQQFFFGKAPNIVLQNSQKIIDSLKEYEDKDRQKYGYGELFTVWLSQFTGKNYATPHEVCSLFVQHRWEVAGFPTPGCMSPGEFLFVCESVSRIQFPETA